MTEKRFCKFMLSDYDDHTVHFGVKDCQTGEFYSAEDNRNANKLLELLNKLHEENQELRKYLGWQDMELEEMEDAKR